jgi:hypothetical protein
VYVHATIPVGIFVGAFVGCFVGSFVAGGGAVVDASGIVLMVLIEAIPACAQQ